MWVEVFPPHFGNDEGGWGVVDERVGKSQVDGWECWVSRRRRKEMIL